MFSSKQAVGLLGVALPLFVPATLQGQKMYWVDRGWIQRAKLDGSNVERLVEVTYLPVDLALDLTDGKIYWTDLFGSRIQRANLDGSGVETVADTDPSLPVSIALDTERGRLYWGVWSLYGYPFAIYCANLDGSYPQVIIDGLYRSKGGLALDPGAGKIYWTGDDGYGTSIQRADLNGSNLETVVTPTRTPYGLALDLTAGKIYWTFDSFEPPRLQRANLDGSEVETIPVEGGAPVKVALDVPAGKMYWTVRHVVPMVRRANLDGSNIEDLILQRDSRPYAIAVDTRCQADGPDCQENGLPDSCDIARAISRDCDLSGIPDECELADGSSLDCNQNDIPDVCERADDCNSNGVQDICDLFVGTSLDCNDNGIPDECEPDDDCNDNGLQDFCDLADGTSVDCDENAVPDECQIDCNQNGVADTCELECNGNGIPDICDVADGTSGDCNGNMIPDECDIDCNGNLVPDECDIADGTSFDEDGSGIPDECEVFSGCLSGADYFDYSPHRENGEAEQLAMNLTSQLRAPNEEYNRILRDLHLVHLTIPETATVVGRGDHHPKHLLVRLYVDMPHSGYDQLNTFYQVIDDHEYTIVEGLHLLTFCDNINVPVLAQEYELLPEVQHAEPDTLISIDDEDEVWLTVLENAFRYTIWDAWSNCPSGWICHVLWLVDVDELGSVSLVSYETYGGCCCAFCDDCNQNHIADACDIACGPPLGECDVSGCGWSADCNANGIPDECDLRGDFNEDGYVVVDDHAAFIDTFFGPTVTLRCSMADLYRDGQVDLRDFAEFQVAFGQ